MGQKTLGKRRDNCCQRPIMDEGRANKFKSCGDWLTGFTTDGVKYGGN